MVIRLTETLKILERDNDMLLQTLDSTRQERDLYLHERNALEARVKELTMVEEQDEYLSSASSLSDNP